MHQLNDDEPQEILIPWNGAGLNLPAAILLHADPKHSPMLPFLHLKGELLKYRPVIKVHNEGIEVGVFMPVDWVAEHCQGGH